MNRFLLCLVSVLFVAACSDDKTETDAEYEARLRAADQEAADGTIGRIGETESIEPQPAPHLSNHPLSRFFIPQGWDALNYVGDFYNLCDRKHSAYTDETCDAAIERGIRVGASIGIRLTRADLDNPDYWQMHLSLFEAKKRHQEEHFASLGHPPTLMDQTTYGKQFREQAAALMKDMDDN